jgi:protein TonB
MARTYHLRDEAHFDLSRAQRSAKIRIRLALALAFSLVFHIGVGTGMAPRAPGRLLAPAVLPFTVQLQGLATQPVRKARFEHISHLEAKAPQSPSSSTPGGRRADDKSLSAEQRHRAAGGAPVENGETSGGLPQPPQSGDTYYTAQDLDVYPTPRAPLKLEHPNGAGPAQVSGQVLVVLTLNEAGIPDEVSILRSEPQGYFEDAVRAALAGVRFFPAQKDGHAVKSRIQIRLEFEPD